MKRIVVDASVTLAWLLKDESSAYAESILRSLPGISAVVPAHWILEVTNSLLSAERKQRLTVADVSKALTFLDVLPISIDSLTNQNAASQTLSLARTYKLTTYDAAYLELSLREGLALATLDSDLLKACRLAGVSVA